MNSSIILLEEVPDNFMPLLDTHKNPKFFSLTFHAHQSLEKKKIFHEHGDKFLSTKDKTKINDLAISATINWKKNLTDNTFFKIDNIDLTKFLELELVPYFLSIYRIAFSIIRIIENEKPKTIICASSLNHFIQNLCEKNNIQFISHESKKKFSLEYDNINIKYDVGPIPISFTISRKFFKKIKTFLNKITHTILTSNYNPENKSILLLDFNPLSYDTLFYELSKLDKNILILNQRRPAIWSFQSFKIIKNSKVNIIYLDDYVSENKHEIKKNLNQLNQQLDMIFKSDKLFVNFFELESISIWPSIKDSFLKICKERMTESITRLILLKYFFKKNNISVILEWAELGQEEKEVLQLAKQNQIQTISLQHAMFPTSKIWNPFSRFVLTYNYPLESTFQAIWGKSSEQHILKLGFNKNTIVTGSPRHDKFFLNNQNIQKKKTGKILLATTTISDYDTNYSTIDYYIKFNSFVKEVYDVVKSFPDKELIVKPHPGSNFLNNILDFLHEIDPKIKITHTQNLVELISDCDLVITFNNSTIALESIILGVPVISLEVEEWTTDIAIVNEGAILAISEKFKIKDGINKILNDINFRRNLIANSKKFVDEYMTNQGTASLQIAKLLNTF
jgi:hypothetical protein